MSDICRLNASVPNMLVIDQAIELCGLSNLLAFISSSSINDGDDIDDDDYDNQVTLVDGLSIIFILIINIVINLDSPIPDNDDVDDNDC